MRSGTAVQPVAGAYRNLRYETVVNDFMTAVGSPELAERIPLPQIRNRGDAEKRRGRNRDSCLGRGADRISRIGALRRVQILLPSLAQCF